MTTRTHTDTFPAGSQVALDLQPTSLTLTVTEPEPPTPPRQRLLVGMEGPYGTETQRILSGFPNVQAMREFGTKRAGESLPSLPGWTSSKLATMPAGCRPHASWKQWDTARQAAWLDARPTVPGASGYWGDLDTTYWHEPHGDIDPVLYRQRGTAWANMLAGHPRGAGIQNGPIVTRYWLCDPSKNGNPLDWWYEGATFYGVDVYEPTTTAVPMSSADLYGPPLEKVYAAIPDGVDVLIPELGRRSAPGQARADALRADLEYLTTQHPRVRTVCAFNASTFPEFAFAGAAAATVTDGGRSTPEGQVWAAAMH